jgi:hypothetical protein
MYPRVAARPCHLRVSLCYSSASVFSPILAEFLLYLWLLTEYQGQGHVSRISSQRRESR